MQFPNRPNQVIVYYDAPRPYPNTAGILPPVPDDAITVVLTHHPHTVKRRLTTRPEKTIIVVNANSLRDNQSHCRLGTLSCEQVAVDLRRELVSPNQVLCQIADQAKHLVIGLNAGAAIHCCFPDTPNRCQDAELTLVYHPLEGYAPVRPLGTDVGFCAILTAGIVEHTANHQLTKLVEGIKRGIVYAIRQRSKGYTAALDAQDHSTGQKQWCKSIFQEDPSNDVRTIKHQQLDIPLRRPGEWSILTQLCDGRDKKHSISYARKKSTALDIATDIIRYGLKDTACGIGPAGKSTVNFPYTIIGNIRTVDRAEIEQYQSIRNLMRDYLEKPDTRPLCLAAFGPPGSGKSLGIKQAAASLADQHANIGKNPLEFSLAGFAGTSGLADALHKSRDVSLGGVVPVVMLDEFDCNFENRSLGWLKYLLAPMQDGKFREGQAEYNVGQAILVFIGGTRRTFEEFAGQMRNREFIEAKGPDFVSRLRGHVNIRGINRIDEEDYLYVIRRAVALRYHLEIKFERDRDEKFEDTEIDPSLLRALLSVEYYHHGVRSLEQIIRMCDTGSPRRQLTHSSLPPRNQLDMHVDAAHFWDLLKENR